MSKEAVNTAALSNDELIEQYSVAMTRQPWNHPPHRKERHELRNELRRRLNATDAASADKSDVRIDRATWDRWMAAIDADIALTEEKDAAAEAEDIERGFIP